jgi:hypothetical protein
VKNSEELQSEKYLLMFKLDAKNLFSRVLYRKPEYITIFALKRTRDHFIDIFKNRYRDVTLSEISHCALETIQALNDFYDEVDSIRWYLITTEDMPNSVSDELDRRFIRLEELHNSLILQIDKELGIESDILMGTVAELSFQEEETAGDTLVDPMDDPSFESEELEDFSGNELEDIEFQDLTDPTDPQDH